MSTSAKGKAQLQTKRVHDEPAGDDGVRVLVDRVWPRGISKDRAALDEWLKELAPSTGLRQWFDHDPARWEGFQRHYLDELREARPAALDRLKQLLADADRVTLLFGSRQRAMNNAVALKRFLDEDLV